MADCSHIWLRMAVGKISLSAPAWAAA